MIIVTTCIICGRSHEVDIAAMKTRCPHCGHFYHLDDDDRADEPDPDYGGAFDGREVTSDADPGL
jgi:predicted  nucleic acid-binding Zn-ribbon protein